jgi:hypothetical protein
MRVNLDPEVRRLIMISTADADCDPDSEPDSEDSELDREFRVTHGSPER